VTSDEPEAPMECFAAPNRFSRVVGRAVIFILQSVPKVSSWWRMAVDRGKQHARREKLSYQMRTMHVK